MLESASDPTPSGHQGSALPRELSLDDREGLGNVVEYPQGSHGVFEMVENAEEERDVVALLVFLQLEKVADLESKPAGIVSIEISDDPRTLDVELVDIDAFDRRASLIEQVREVSLVAGDVERLLPLRLWGKTRSTTGKIISSRV
jgi:hypothetical protein